MFSITSSCSFNNSSGANSTEDLQFTQSPTPKPIQPTITLPTQIPSLTPSPETRENTPTPFLLETEHFQSPQGFFEFDYPSDWVATQENSTVTFDAPSHNAFLRVSVIDTGYSMDADSFARMVNGRESNVFQMYRQFFETSRQIESQKAIITKQFFLNGVKKVVRSYYHQSDQVVYVVDLWSNQETLGITEEIFSAIIPTLKMNPLAVVGQDQKLLYGIFLYETDYFSFQVPDHWKLARTFAESSVVDTFRSPDEKAIFQTIVYNDGKPISKLTAGSIVLALLNNFYTKNITVTIDSIISDQQEKLTWHSSLSDMQGITSFQVRDDTLIIFTILYKNDNESIYQPILEQILSTYQPLPATNNP